MLNHLVAEKNSVNMSSFSRLRRTNTLSTVLLFVFLLSCINFFPDLRRSLEAKHYEIRQIDSGDDIPKIAHYMVLGDDPKKYMMEMVRVSIDRITATGWKAQLWRDHDAERIVANFNDPELTKTWDYIKADKNNYAKQADFLRPLIMYVEGGVYLDADMVPCESLDFMVDEPGVVSFPYLYGSHNQVNGALMSSPPGHLLMKMALESFIALGPAIQFINNLIAAGPVKMAEVTDEYIRLKNLDLPLPLFSTGDKDPYNDAPNVAEKYGDWTKIDDIRFMHPVVAPYTYHLHFMSWIPGHKPEDKPSGDQQCYEHPSLIKPWVDHICKPNIRHHGHRFAGCREIGAEE